MTRAEEIVCRRIGDRGRITFAEFMELALYGPGGYYASGTPIGRRGDYYTSPSAHPMFGALLALQLEQLWRLLDAPSRFTVVEPGAGDGRLAQDVLTYARHLDDAFACALEYVAIDRPAGPAGPAAGFLGGPASGRGVPGVPGGPAAILGGTAAIVRGPAGPAASFSGWAASGVSWLRCDRAPLRGLTGCVLSNELVDSLPVHRVVMTGGRLRELYVTLADGALAEEAGEPSTPEIAELLESQGVRLGEGWQAEVGLDAWRWMEGAAASLRRGYVLTIDYGDPAERLYTEARKAGTVMSYYQHTPESDVLARVGLQDLTAHANFTTLLQAGRKHGLEPVALMDQRSFLRNLGADLLIDRLRREPLPQAERQANLMAMRDLVKPGGLGAFRVLLQAKDAPVAGLACMNAPLADQEAWRRRLESLPVPMLTPEHLDLLAARYPHQVGSWESFKFR